MQLKDVIIDMIIKDDSQGFPIKTNTKPKKLGKEKEVHIGTEVE